MRLRYFCSTFSILCLSLLPLSAPGEPRVRVLTNASIIDGTGAPVQENMNLVIRGAVISGLSSGPYVPTGEEDEVVDLSGAFVTPGFWNMHVHLTALLPHNHMLDKATVGAKVIRAGVNAMEGLRHGFTAIRSVGEEHYIDVAWQQAFDEGYLLGPRIFASGASVAPTAGHRGDVPNGADGMAEVRKAVRSRVQRGASLIKIANVEMLPDELAAAVETAHSLGVHVAAHSREPAVRTAVEAGVDSIEHGYGLSDASIQRMVEKGTFYDPTIICNLSDAYIQERETRLASLGYAEDEQAVRLRTAIAYADERSPEHARRQRQALAKAAKAGVKLLIGSDSMPIGEIGWLEMEQFVRSGVSEMDTLVAATRNPAELLGVLDRLGTVEVGKLADLVVLAANPLENISNIRTVQMVFKDGIAVPMEPVPGTLRFYDYFDSQGPPRSFLERSEAAAGFSREGNPYAGGR